MKGLADLWAGRLPLGVAFWIHMVVICFAVNAVATVGSLAVIAAGLAAPVALAVHLLPLPYTVACATGVWRSAGRYDGAPALADAARAAALFWAGIMILA
ncbi:MAG TPA: hypothetical protein VLA52_17575 [Thermohalobaculum sp.]|nr:hypothetical protein [Thermohalobaculum sp.]